jgi:hypothetical protein
MAPIRLLAVAAAAAALVAGLDLPRHDRAPPPAAVPPADLSTDTADADEADYDDDAVLSGEDDDSDHGDVDRPELEQDWHDPQGPVSARRMSPWEAHGRRLQAPCSSQTVTFGWWSGSSPATPGSSSTGW